MTTPDPLDEGVPRDARGRPLIIPLKGKKPNPAGKLTAYTRASTFAKALDDPGGLATWKVRHGVVGVAVSPDLAAMVAAMGSNPDEYDAGAKRELDTIIETAHDRSGGNAKANYGTAVHSLTETVDPLRVAIDPGMARDVDAYTQALTAAQLEPVAAEVLVVNDRLKVAGTYDHKYRLGAPITVEFGDETVTLDAGTLILGDKKTGRLDLLSHAVQLAVYARGSEYNHTTGERIANDVTPQWGIVAHIPRGEATCTLYLLDLRTGWKAAQTALQVREWRSAAGQRAMAVTIGEASARVAGAPSVAQHPQAAHPQADVVEPADRADGMPTHGGKDDDQITDIPTPAVDEFGDPITPAGEIVETAGRKASLQRDPAPEPTMGDATTRVAATLDAAEIPDPIMQAIDAATDSDACAALWRAHRAEWNDAHTAAVKTRLAALQAAA